MKRITQNLKKTAIAIAFLLLTIPAFCQQTNFSGKWQLNKSKTDFKTNTGQQAPEWIMPRALQVNQSGKSLIVDRTMLTNVLAEKHYSENISVDGTPSEATTAMGNKETASLTWNGDQPHIILKINVVNGTGDLLTNATEEWTLTDQGKTLLVDRQVEQGDGSKYEIKAYFDKQ